MATVNRLGTYLALEREMLRLDALGVDLADTLRDAMDPIWHQLGPEERKFLNERTIPVRLSELEPIHGPLTLPTIPSRRPGFVEAEVIHSASWRCAA